MELFEWIVKEIADKMGYLFPEEKFQDLKQLV
ncbi:MAG: hypothetical protein ACFFC1_02045, partial [Promethearchaeota archaeon]